MTKSTLLKMFATRFWGLPLVLSLGVIPVASALSVRLWLTEGYVYLIYLPLAAIVALLMVFHWSALPGIVLALCVRYGERYTLVQAITIVAVFMIAISICWGGYSQQANRRWRSGFGELQMIAGRLFWLAFALPTLFIILMQIVTPMNILPLDHSIFSSELFSTRTLLNYQSVMLALLSSAQLFYFLFRVIRNPRFCLTLYHRCRSEFSPTVTCKEWALWQGLVLFLLYMLTQIRFEQDNLLSTDYGVPLLLPLMLWSAVRFGYLFTSLSWGFLLIVLYQLRDRYLSPETDGYHLAVMSANLLVFTLTILLMSAISTRQRRLLDKARIMARTDPVLGLPNVRALNQALASHSGAVLCFLRIPELEHLSRTYGLQLSIHYKRSLARHLHPWLLPAESVYQMPGFDLVLRLEYTTNRSRIETLETRLKDFYLHWEELPVRPEVGISYCHVTPPVCYLYELLSEMSAMAEVSLRSGHVENVQPKETLPIQRHINNKVMMLKDIQQALQHQTLQLMVQKVHGVRGDDYYDILLQVVTSNGVLLQPTEFMPVVQEFGLTWEMDLLVLNQILAFIDRHRQELPGIRVSVSVFAATLRRPQLAADIAARLHAYNIEPWQLLIEVAEVPIFNRESRENQNIARLRQLGCRIAIDELGAGYSGYSRLKQMQADILKIDSTFVRNMLQSSLDYQIIESICMTARLKRMQIVAEGVETQDVAIALRKLGIDYLQGPLMGEPEPLEHMLTAPEKQY